MNHLKLLYYTNYSNFGDILNELLIAHLLGRHVTKASEKSATLVGIGSLLELLLHSGGNLPLKIRKAVLGSINIWGTGFIAPENTRVGRPNDLPEQFFRDVNVFALRGTKTLSRVAAITGRDLSNTPLGDPGILCDMLVEPTHETQKKKYRIGVIPHYVDQNQDSVRNLLSSADRSLLIDVLDHPSKVLQQIQACELVISSAMHGLIASDSLGVPNIRAIFSDAIVGGDYKFDDYYSVFGVSNHRKFDLREKELSDLDDSFIREEHPVSRDAVNTVREGLLKSAQELRRYLES